MLQSAYRTNAMTLAVILSNFTLKATGIRGFVCRKGECEGGGYTPDTDGPEGI